MTSATTIHEDARSVGLEPERWQRVLDLLADWCRRGLVPSAAIVCGRSDRMTATHVFGNQALDGSTGRTRDDAIFLVASITKPIVAMGALLLVERGQLSLDDRVCEIVSQFRGRGKYGVTVRHLLTHTSGLPDMLVNNRELRESHSGLDAFVAGACAAEMGFPPGRGTRYQSMGFGILGEIIRIVSGQSCADFLRHEVFEPLWMGPNPGSRGLPRFAFPKISKRPPRIGAGTAPTGASWGRRGGACCPLQAIWAGSPKRCFLAAPSTGPPSFRRPPSKPPLAINSSACRASRSSIASLAHGDSGGVYAGRECPRISVTC